MKVTTIFAAVLLSGITQVAYSAQVSVPIHIVNESGLLAVAGEIVVQENEHGLLFTPNLTGLPLGTHGFHIHQNPSCEPLEKEGKKIAALAAGGHWDPSKSNKHAGPYGDGHMGDLPALYVGADGKATYPVLAPRLKTLDQVRGRALMIHAGADNHDDHPVVLGGGGARVACGVIAK